MKCSIEDCEKDAKHKGLCSTHYKRQWRHGDPLKTLTPGRGFERIQCIAEGCERISDYSCGLCENHYNMQLKYGRTHTIMAPKGVGGFDLSGYYLITVDGRRVYEHIYKAEKALGRSLPEGAVVHHMNNIPFDNDTPYNLVICPDQAYHMLIHKRMRDLGYENN